MPIPSLRVTVQETQRNIDRLVRYRSGSGALDPTFQHLISELLLLRLVAILEAAIDDLACKLLAGAAYINGTQPVRLKSAKSIAKAKQLILASRKNGNSRYLTWTKASIIRDNVSSVISSQDPFVIYAQAHAIMLDEMRKVRNYVAHNSLQARGDFQGVVRSVYGRISQYKLGPF